MDVYKRIFKDTGCVKFIDVTKCSKFMFSFKEIEKVTDLMCNKAKREEIVKFNKIMFKPDLKCL